MFAVAMFLSSNIALAVWPNVHNRSSTYPSLDVSPQGEQIVFSAAGEGGLDLYLMELKSRQVSRIAATLAYETDPSFSPDGKSIVYSAGIPGDRADHIFVRKLDGGDPTQLTAEDANDTKAKFSPDGSLILFGRATHYFWGGLAASWGGYDELCLIAADGTKLRRFAGDQGGLGAHDFSADGKSIYYWNDGAVYSIPVATLRAPFKLRVEEEARANYSADRQFVATSRGRFMFETEIFVSNLDGTGMRQVTDREHLASVEPRFLPDGKSIIFIHASPRSGYAIWHVNVDGSDLKELADGSLFSSPLKWKPKSP